jgi:hypothetical protein
MCAKRAQDVQSSLEPHTIFVWWVALNLGFSVPTGKDMESFSVSLLTHISIEGVHPQLQSCGLHHHLETVLQERQYRPFCFHKSNLLNFSQHYVKSAGAFLKGDMPRKQLQSPSRK